MESVAGNCDTRWYRRAGDRQTDSGILDRRPQLGTNTAKALVTRILDKVTVAGPLISVVTTIAVELTQPNYHPVHDTISSLVWGRYGWVQTSVFYLLGLTTILMAVRVSAITRQIRLSRTGQALLALLGAAFVVIAIFPTSSDPGLSGIQASVHQQTVRAMSVIFPLACLLISASMSPRYRAVRVYTLATAVVAVGLIPAGAVATFTDAPWLGGIERVILANGLLWAEIVAVQTWLSPRQFFFSYDRSATQACRSAFGVSIQRPELLAQYPAVLKDDQEKGNF